MVCWTYYNLLHTLPAVVRKWWVDSEHKVSTLVDKLTTKYVSQSLIVQEFQDIKQAKKIDNIVVFICSYTLLILLGYGWTLIFNYDVSSGELVRKPRYTRRFIHDRRNGCRHHHTDGQ